MIFYLHTPDDEMKGSGMCGSDHIPRVGEKIRIAYPKTDEWANQDRSDQGLYEVLDVLYEVPNNPSRQRIDVYAKKVCDLPGGLSFEAWQDATYQAKLRQETENG